MFESFLRATKLVLCALIIVCMTSCANIDSNKYKQEAKPVADEFLSLVDEGNYFPALEKIKLRFATDLSLRRNIATRLEQTRQPMGKTLKREFFGAIYHTTFQSMPDGQYLQMFYHTDFENKKFAREYVTLLKENNAWLVFNYGIQ